MKSIKNEVIKEIRINKSIFINYLVPVNSVEEVNNCLIDLRKKYSDANHHCFAYILGNNQEVQKYSDDGEPNKTAGMPMIEVLKKHELTNVLNVSVRYFGGIKLGAGGLVRAYTKGCADSVKSATFTYLVDFSSVRVSIPFDEIGHSEKYIRDHFKLTDTTYDDSVNYFIEVETSKLNKFSESINERTSGKADLEVISTFEVYI